jgi:hypothetical protein
VFAGTVRTEGCGDTFFSRTYKSLFCRKGPCREHCDNEGADGGYCIFFYLFVRCICNEKCSSKIVNPPPPPHPAAAAADDDDDG